jgi:hypothetical protein
MLERVIRLLIPRSITISPDLLVRRLISLLPQLGLSVRSRDLENDTQESLSRTLFPYLPTLQSKSRPSDGRRTLLSPSTFRPCAMGPNIF